MVDQISTFLIFFGGVMSWTIALGQLIKRKGQTFNYMFAGFMFSMGIVQFLNVIVVSDKIVEYSYLTFLQLPFLVLTGPTFYFCFKSVIGSNYFLKRLDFLHGIPALLVVLMLIPFFRMEPGVKKIIFITTPSFINNDPEMVYYSGIVMAVILVLMGYIIYFFREFFSMFSVRFIKEKKASIAFIISIICIYATDCFLFVFILMANFVEYPDGLYVKIIQSLTMLSFFITFLIFFVSRRDGNYYKGLQNQAEKIRYEKSKIKNLDIALILSRIKSLMTEEKIFCDEDLNLNSFARELEIGPNQLSQIINENFDENFNAFINKYRIEEAKKMLIEDRDRTVVSISYAVGFNSPARFYEWFFKITEVTPSRFRKK